MKRLDYFKYAMEKELYRYRAWLMLMYSIPVENTEYTKNFHYKTTESEIFFDVDGELVKIEDYIPGEPILPINGIIELPKGFMGFVDDNITTTFGCATMNILMLYEPYRGKVKYQNKQLTPALLNGIAEEMLTTDKATVEEHIRFEDMCEYVTCLSRVIVGTLTDKSMSAPKPVIELRDKLLKQHAHELTNPSVYAGIEKQLAEAYREYLKDDPSSEYLYDGKSISSLLRTEVMYGSEPDFFDETKIKVIKDPLAKGWSKENIDVLTNTARAGIYNRGVATAMGGAAVKEVNRIFQNYAIEGTDCNAKEGLDVKLSDINYEEYVGRYLVGRKTPLTLDELSKLKGKTITIRSPGFCLMPRPTKCMTCMGDAVSHSKEKIGGQMTTMFSSYMLVFMKLMHSTSLKSAKFNPDNSIL